MLKWLVVGMVFCGAALMVYNIYGFIRFALYIKGIGGWDRKSDWILYLPIALLVMFLLGYLGVGPPFSNLIFEVELVDIE